MQCISCNKESGSETYCIECAPKHKPRSGSMSSLLGFGVPENEGETTEEYLLRQSKATEDFLANLEREREDTREELKRKEKEIDDYVMGGQKQRNEDLLRMRREKQEASEKSAIELAKSLGASDKDAVRRTFDELSEPIGQGVWEIKGLKYYYPSGPLEIPGSSFSELCPSQSKVNKETVEFKLKKLPACPVIPVMLDENGRIVLRDKHHTFVACMALGRPVQLALIEKGVAPSHANWSGCQWTPYEGSSRPLKGFSLPPSHAHLEGEIEEPPPDWEEIVPWPTGKSSKVERLPEETKNALQNSEEGVDLLDEETKNEFHRRLEGALQLEQIKKHFDQLLDVKGFKIKFDPTASGAHFVGSTIVLPTMKNEEQITDAADLVDAFIFESCNLAVKGKYEEHDKNFGKNLDSLKEFSKKKSEIEATDVVLRSARMTSSMKKNGQKIAEQGAKNILAIEKIDPGFFDEFPVNPERESRLIEALVRKMSETKHVEELDPDKDEKSLKDCRWLKSTEMYHYEKCKAMGNLLFVQLLAKRVPPQHLNRPVRDWLKSCWDLCKSQRERLPLAFCLVMDVLKEKFDVNFADMEFSPDMLRVARANGDGLSLPPYPVIQSDTSVDELEGVEIGRMD